MTIIHYDRRTPLGEIRPRIRTFSPLYSSSALRGGPFLRALTIPRNVVDSHCLSGCENLSNMVFKDEPRLVRIEGFAFAQCPLRSAMIPRNFQAVWAPCFSYSGFESPILFKDESRLNKLEPNGFSDCSLGLTVVRRRDLAIGSLHFKR
jgi:hypothetical protein